MPRHKGKGRGGNRGGKQNGHAVNWSHRGGHAGGTRVAKRGGGHQHQHQHQQQHQQQHQHHNKQRWVWHKDKHQDDVEPMEMGSDADAKDHGFINPKQSPRPEKNPFSILPPPSPGGPGKPGCLLPDCRRVKKNLTHIQQQARRLRKALKRALKDVGSELWDFLCEGEDEFDEDVDPMDWTPEPTVNLIVVPSPEPIASPQVDQVMYCSASSSPQ